MPHYDYECLECGDVFEVFQKMSDEPVLKCPKCKGKAKRLIGGGCGLIFKGSGFYITDYKKNVKSGSSASQSSDKKKTSAVSGKNESVSKNKDTDKKE